MLEYCLVEYCYTCKACPSSTTEVRFFVVCDVGLVGSICPRYAQRDSGPVILTTKDKAMTSLLCCWRKAVDVQPMCGFALSCWSIKPDKFDAFCYFLPSRKHDFYEVAWSQTQPSHFHQVKNRSFCWTQQSWARNV